MENNLTLSQSSHVSAIAYVGPLTKVIPLKFFLHTVPSSSTDIARTLRACFREGSVYMYVVSFRSFRFKAKKNLQRCRDIFFDILITSKEASALGIFKYILKLYFKIL